MTNCSTFSKAYKSFCSTDLYVCHIITSPKLLFAIQYPKSLRTSSFVVSKALLLVLARRRLVMHELLLRLLVAMHNELVQEATRFAMIVAARLSFIDVAREVACCFIVYVVLIVDVVDVCWEAC